MKSQLVAVFQHFDSRGGTIAFPVDAADENAVADAMKRYDKLVGYEAHKHVEHAHQPPSVEDFVYIAQLHYPDDVEFGHGDWDYSYGDQTTAVLGAADADEDWVAGMPPRQLEVVKVPRKLTDEEADEAQEEGTTFFNQWLQVLDKETAFQPRWNDDACGFYVVGA